MANGNYTALADNIASRVAQQYGIDPAYFKSLFHAQINQESGFNPNARSGAGAEGIAQIVPKYHPGVDPYNPQQALTYAAKWDAQMYKKYGNPRDVLSVYNSGRPWAQGQGISETNNYVKSILAAAGGGGGSVSRPTTTGYGAQPQGDMSTQRNALLQGILQWASGGSQSASQPVPAPGQGNFNPMGLSHGPDLSNLVNAAWGTPGGNRPTGGPPPTGLWGGGKPSKFQVGGKLVNVGAFGTRPGIQLAAPIAGQAEALAKRFGLKINSGYRSPEHNASVGGAKNSDHLSGDAVDYTGSPAAMRALYNYALKAGYAYVEPWAQAGGNHVHISFARGVKA